MRGHLLAPLALVLGACPAPSTESPSKPPAPNAPSGPTQPATRGTDEPAAGRTPAAAGVPIAWRAPPASPELAPKPPASPLGLTASDGTGLKLVSLRASGVIEEPLAFTELRMVFENPEPRVIEGQFRITLPIGASISRFAMKIGDRWQEGEVVERQAARRAYEDFLHRRQDPALLEQGAANEFTARVFPIPARGTKELILSYSQELVRGDEPYRIPLVGLPELGELEIRALVAKTKASGVTSNLGGSAVRHEVVEVKKQRFVPTVDFEVPQTHDQGRLGLRHDNLVVARITPLVDAEPEPLASLLVLIDTSASRSLGFARQIAIVRDLVRGFADGGGGALPLAVAAFDQDVEPIYEGTISGFGERELRALNERRALGASDLSKALEWAATRKGSPYRRVLLVTDGVATAGATEGDALLEAVKKLRTAEVERMDAISVGGIRDDEMLARMVRTGLPKAGVVIDGSAPLTEIARKLTIATRASVPVSVPGARWVWPDKLEGLQAGDQVLVYADLPKESPFSLSIGGVEISTADRRLDPTERPLLERAWVKARIARLLYQRDTMAASDADMRGAIVKQVIELSTKHRVLSPFTALLVLETEWDYRRFNIDRTALADILTVGATGIELMNRSAPALPAPPTTIAQQPKEPPRPQPRPASPTRNRPAAGAPADGDALGAIADETARAPADEARDPDSPAPAEALAALPAEAAPAAAEPKPEPMREEATVRSAPAKSAASSESAAGGPPAARRPAASPPPPPPPPSDLLEEERPSRPRQNLATHESPERVDPYTGTFKELMSIVAKDPKRAVARALAWHEESPGDVLALIALGEAFEASRDSRNAARAYGSLIDLFPSRADLRRFAGQRLERVASAEAARLAADTFAKAADQRPDHPASHRLLAFALLRAGELEKAFAAIERGIRTPYPDGRFRGVSDILREDAGLIAAAWIKAEPSRRDEILSRLQGAGGRVEDAPSLRFVLNWETDANDVDFHIYDGRGGHAYFGTPELPTGGRLYADVTTGYGPECFTIRAPRGKRATPYKLQAHYFRRGPMGYGMGKLEIVDHDGKGGLRFEQRPFVVMTDGAYLDLGVVK